jgi:hypothetical protein
MQHQQELLPHDKQQHHTFRGKGKITADDVETAAQDAKH